MASSDKLSTLHIYTLSCKTKLASNSSKFESGNDNYLEFTNVTPLSVLSNINSFPYTWNSSTKCIELKSKVIFYIGCAVGKVTYIGDSADGDASTMYTCIGIGYYDIIGGVNLYMSQEEADSYNRLGDSPNIYIIYFLIIIWYL